MRACPQGITVYQRALGTTRIEGSVVLHKIGLATLGSAARGIQRGPILNSEKANNESWRKLELDE